MSLSRGRCIICTSTFFSHNIAALHCGHTFHFECVRKWVERSKTCPICRVRTEEKQVIQHLYFDSADELDATQLGHNSAAQIEALAVALEKEKNINQEAKMELLILKNSVASLQAEVLNEKRLREKREEKIASLEVQNRQLDMIIVDQQELKKALDKTKSRLRACEFYKVITTGKDEIAIDKYVKDDGEVGLGQFLNLLRRQLNEERKKRELLVHDLDIERMMIRSLKKKVEKLKDIVKALNQELKDVRVASNMGSSTPFNPKLARLALEQSPPKRCSLGFNESVDLDANVLRSALRHGASRVSPRAKERTDMVSQGLILNFSDDENNFGLPDSDRCVPCYALNSVPSPRVPKSVRERVLTCSEYSQSTGLGGAQGPADMALANLELRASILGNSPKKNSLLKRKKSVNDAKNQRLSQFFPKKGRIDVIHLD